MALEMVILGQKLPRDLSLQGLARMTEELEASDKKLDIPVDHKFTPGLYAREVLVPAGTGVITRVHKTAHPFVVSKGKILVWTKESGVILIEAPFTGITAPGTCRVAFALEDTVWTTFHPNPTDERDVKKLETMLAWSPSEAAQLESQKEQKCLS